MSAAPVQLNGMGGDENSDDEAIEVLLSSIEHYAYCPRQCGLIYLEASYRENVYTVRGTQAHMRVDSGVESTADNVRSKRNVPLWSDELAIRGKADLVEFSAAGPYPVEYKAGRRRSQPAEMQLCAQALCLEEMLGQAVTKGAIYYHGLRRRREVVFDAALRRMTLETIAAVRNMIRSQHLPEPLNDRRCKRCSLVQVCLSQVVGEPMRLRGLQGALYTAYGLGEEPVDA